MKKAKPHACYISPPNHNDEITYILRKMGNIMDDWYEDEIYYKYPKYIYFESSTWSGYTAEIDDRDIEISNDEFEKLKSYIETSRKSIVKSLRKVGKKRTSELQEGDYIFYYFSSDINKIYDTSSCYKILEISDNKYKVVELLVISRNSFDFDEVVSEFVNDYEIQWITKGLVLRESEFQAIIKEVKNIMNKLDEMVKQILDLNL